MRTRKHNKPHIVHILTLSLIGMMLAQSLYANSHYGSDSVLELSRTGGYAKLSDANVDDLDYSKDSSVEVITKIEPYSIGGHWGSFIQKAGPYALYNSAHSGFAIGTVYGRYETLGQKIKAAVNDGTNGVGLSSPRLEGNVYAVMTWDSATKKLILYINGDESGNNTNPAINPLNIENNYDLQIGKGLNNLNRDIFMIRVWNRELSPSEVSDLWNNYDTTGQHILPSEFNNTELKSEWLMQQTSDATGSSGTTHIKDTKGTNHLELKDGAEISTGIGYLTVESPSNGATNVDKAVTIKVKGGISNLGSVTKPLHYYFQIDESSSFNSSNLKESGWIKHYGQYKSILKPNTQYYWRVRVRDSASTPVESSYIATQFFTTEGPTNWYVRPAGGSYGNEDGTSYDDAWNGLNEIDWGEDGVEACDNLYISGDHVYSTTSGGNIAYQGIEYITASGFSEEYPITIRMDCSQDLGTIYGFFMDNRVSVVWNGPDLNDVYWTDDLQSTAVAEYNGTDYIWLDTESSTTWIGNYGARFKDGSINYVKTTDGSNPTGKIYSSGMAWSFDLGRNKYVKFYKCDFFGSVVVGKQRIGDTNTDIPVSTHIVFDSCKMMHYGTYWLYAGHDYWTFRNNDFSYAGNGIYTSSLDTWSNPTLWGASYLLVENNTFKHLFHKDGHAVGIQGGRGHIIQGNYIEDTGSAIEFHTGYPRMENMIIRNNFIKDTNVRGAGGHGIVVSGENRDDSIGRRTGFKIYNNIIMNTGIGATEDYEGKGITSNNKDLVEIYNNIIINTYEDGIAFSVINAPAQGSVYNNIIVNPGDRYLQIIGSAGDWSNFSCDYNLYYPAANFTTDFYFAQSIDRDNHSVLADPLFVDPENGDFHLWSDSPAINAGVDVGLTQDFEGNPAPQGHAFDIGAYEAVIDPDNPPPVLQAIGDKSVNENVTLTFTINATDSEPVTYLAQSLPSGATLDPQTGDFAWTPSYSQAGSYQVRFIASDGNSNDSETITITVTNVNRAPILGVISDQSVDENTLLSFSVDATDPDGQALSYSVSGLPTGAVFASQTFTWTPSYDQAGAFAVTFTADDGQDQDSQAITITVNNVNRTPVLAAINNQSVWSDDPLTFTVNATDPDGDTVTYSASTIPSGATFADQDFDWTPSQSQGGSYAVTFTASDGQLQDSQAITITVDVDSLAPTVTNSLPTADSIQAPLNNLINLNITDPGKGTDADSVTIKVNNNTVYTGDTNHYSSSDGECRRLGNKTDYRFVYQSNEEFDYDQTVSITVNSTDLAGNVMSEHSYSFVTEMRSFGENKILSSGSSNDNWGPLTTVSDSSGNIWIAWPQGVVGSRDIYVGKLMAGTDSFVNSGIVQVTEDNYDQGNPVIAIDSSGKLYLAWQDNRQGNWDIYVSTFDGTSFDGTNWSTETMVNEPDNQVDPAPNQTNPAIVVDSTDKVYIAYEDDQAGNQNIYIAISSDGFATQTVPQPITSNSADQVEPAIAAAADLGNTIYVVWTDTRNNGKKDIYGAASDDSWANIPVVTEEDSQSSPAIATEVDGTILHFVWLDDRLGDDDIYYATSDGLPSSPLAGSSVIDEVDTDQFSPVIATTGSTGNDLKVFACWRDERNTEAELYAVEITANGNGTNIYVGNDFTTDDQSQPAIGIDQYGYPYLVWINGRTDICYAGSTFIEPTALVASVTVPISTTTTVGTPIGSIADEDDASVVIPAGAYVSDIDVMISRIRNPQKLPANNRTFLYEFGPSGTTFSEPVTVTIPYNATTLVSSPSVYWYNPLTSEYSQEGITDVEVIQISSGLYALRFKTTHFSGFGGGGPFGGGGLGGGGGGGCSVSAGSEGNIVEFILPYIGLVVVMAILKLWDARERKARST